MENIKIKELAEAYAAGKLETILTTSIADAYTEGFKTGYKVCKEEKPVDMTRDGIEYVDLGLPSGTLWASDYIEEGDDRKRIVYLHFQETDQSLLPTIEQWEELITECRWQYHRERIWDKSGYYSYREWYKCLGSNGNHINFYFSHGDYDKKTMKKENVVFWLQNGRIATCADDAIMKTLDCFHGYKQAIRLVKQ